MASRLNAARKIARAWATNMEPFGRLNLSRKEKARVAMSDYMRSVHESKPYYRNRRNRKVLQRESMRHGFGCTGASVQAFSLFINKVEEIM